MGAQGGSGPPPPPQLESQLLLPELSTSLSIRQDRGMNWAPSGTWGWGRRAQSLASSCPAHTLRSTAKVGAASLMGCTGGEQWGPGQPHTDGALASRQSYTRQSVVCLFVCFHLNVFIFNWRTVALLVSATHQHDSAVGTHMSPPHPTPSLSEHGIRAPCAIEQIPSGCLILRMVMYMFSASLSVGPTLSVPAVPTSLFSRRQSTLLSGPLTWGERMEGVLAPEPGLWLRATGLNSPFRPHPCERNRSVWDGLKQSGGGGE